MKSKTAPDTMTHEERVELTLAWQAIVYEDTLGTRTQFYQWNPARNVYVCTHRG
jgi:hypothetical protein